MSGKRWLNLAWQEFEFLSQKVKWRKERLFSFFTDMKEGKIEPKSAEKGKMTEKESFVFSCKRTKLGRTAITLEKSTKKDFLMFLREKISLELTYFYLGNSSTCLVSTVVKGGDRKK